MKDAALKIFEILFDDVFSVVLFVKIFIVFNLIVWTVCCSDCFHWSMES